MSVRVGGQRESRSPTVNSRVLLMWVWLFVVGEERRLSFALLFSVFAAVFRVL